MNTTLGTISPVLSKLLLTLLKCVLIACQQDVADIVALAESLPNLKDSSVPKISGKSFLVSKRPTGIPQTCVSSIIISATFNSHILKLVLLWTFSMSAPTLQSIPQQLAILLYFVSVGVNQK